MKNAAIKKAKETWEKAQKIWPSLLTYSAPTIAFDMRGKAAGKATPGKINLNLQLLKQEGKEFVSEVVIHELMHCAAWILFGYEIKAHGKEWQNCMILMGETPKRCHGRVNKNGFEYVCRCSQNHFLSAKMHNRFLRGETLVCLICKNPIKWKKLI